VRSALLLVPAVGAVWGSLEEFTPLLAAASGVAVAAVPLLLLLLDAGMVAGGLTAGRVGGRTSRPALALRLAIGGAAMAVGAAVGHPAGFVALAVAFGAFQAATVVADARLQHAIEGPARATVTSLAGLATDLATIAVYGLYALGSVGLDDAGLFVVAGGAYLVIAALVAAGATVRRAGRGGTA
jgi:predicted MFS family arabinose efflux permease